MQMLGEKRKKNQKREKNHGGTRTVSFISVKEHFLSRFKCARDRAEGKKIDDAPGKEEHR